MFNIVISDNLLQLFIFWEIVGFCSYLLIGFWYENDAATNANKKAFITNRIGDIGFIIGIITLWASFGTLDIETLSKIFVVNDGVLLVEGEINNFWLIVAGIGLFFGCVGKSAQFPLQTWLPNAMEGPTPVSALIHAATMVAAGIYLLAKVFPFLHPVVLTYIAYTGAITAFMGAFAALSQTDIKRVLAFSTISQLGYMVMAMGAGAYEQSLLHLVTHAFFKACLFLCAGAVIHSMHVVMEKMNVHEDAQNMRMMGGLRKRMRLTFITYTIACASLIGLPFTSGFLSKDAILIELWYWGQETGHWAIPILGLLTVLLTAFYMIRQWILVFWGDLRLTEKCLPCSRENMEAPIKMRIPTVVLAVLSLSIFYSLNPFHASHGWFMETIEVPKRVAGTLITHAINTSVETIIPIVSLLLLLIGATLAYLIYGKKSKAILRLKTRFAAPTSFLYRLSFNNWYMDEIYQVVFVSPVLIFSSGVALFDRYVVDKIVVYASKSMLLIAYLFAKLEMSIVVPLVEKFGKLNVVGAEVLGWWDSYVFDGIVTVVGKCGLYIGQISRSTQNGKIQSYLLLSIMLLIGLIILLVFV